MSWNTEINMNKVIYNGEVVFEKEGALTAEDVKKAAREAGIRGKFDVYDAETGEELLPSNFPYDGSVEIEPRHTAA